MAKYKIVATKIEYFEIEVDAESQKEALEFAREHKELFKFYSIGIQYTIFFKLARVYFKVQSVFNHPNIK